MSPYLILDIGMSSYRQSQNQVEPYTPSRDFLRDSLWKNVDKAVGFSDYERLIPFRAETKPTVCPRKMTSPDSIISEVLGHCPADLASFYADNQPQSEVTEWTHILNLNAACEYTKMLNGIPVVDRLGLWALNDANDSNPYCYISKGPCQGGVILFSHDPEPEIRFSSLANFVRAISEAADLEDIRVELDLAFNLDSEITSLLKEEVLRVFWWVFFKRWRD
ncbi:hypothetical protein BH11VER1_BH11VER1_07900 [soil metagenome]